MRTAIPTVAALGTFLALPLALLGCSDSGKGSGATTGAALTAGTTTTAGTTATVTTSASAATSAAAPPVQSCAIDEAQYNDWDEFGKDCGFAYPKTPGALPPRIAWEPCGPAVGLGGCRKLKLRADATLHNVHAGAKRADVIEVAYVEECAAPTSKGALMVIAEVDGPTLASFASKAHQPGKCDIDISSIAQGAYTAILSESGDSGPGALVGAPTLTSKPALLRTWEPGKADKGGAASDKRWVSFGPNGARTARWSQPDPETITDNALNVPPVLHRDDIFWADVDMYIVKTAPKPEKLRGSDTSSASALGTDGNEIAFTSKENGDQPRLTLAAGPYTVDPDKLAFKTILPLAIPTDTTPWTVGCGHAAHATDANEILIVRLRDGLSWTATSTGCNQPDGLCLTRPMALTCKEVFVAAADKTTKAETIVRLALNTLGKGKEPPTPPAPFGAPAASATPSASPSAAPNP